jgi:hypothetical protein
MEQAEKYWVSACFISYRNTCDYYLILRIKHFCDERSDYMCYTGISDMK